MISNLKIVACVRATCLVGVALITAELVAAVQLPDVVSDHMVLQRDVSVPIWGQAAPGEKVTVTFRDQQKSATADAGGRWRLVLDAMQAGGPDELTVSAENKVVVKDVLVGEVWVGSGQSNMAGNAGGYASRGDQELAKLLDSAPHNGIRLLRSPGVWTPATKENCAGFSALLLAFGGQLHAELDVPVGLIVGAVGGTPSCMWISEQAYGRDEACKRVIAEAARSYDAEAAERRYQVAMAKWEKAAARAKQQGSKPPRKPRPTGKPGEVVGGEIGGLYERYIRPVLGYGMRGVLWDQGEAGTRVVGLDQYTMMGALIRGWRNEWGQGEFPFLYVQKPSGGGCAWDPSDPVTRNANAPAALPDQPTDGRYRETHIRIRAYPQTFMVTATDLGSGVHPTNKWGYGTRAAQVALGAAYGREVAIYGPTYASHTIDGNEVRVRFDNVGRGLAFKHGEELRGFAVAGQDRIFHWADARIDGDAVVVSADGVEDPVAVRYAWSQSHPWANLFNKDGLPALAFRTDVW